MNVIITDEIVEKMNAQAKEYIGDHPVKPCDITQSELEDIYIQGILWGMDFQDKRRFY